VVSLSAISCCESDRSLDSFKETLMKPLFTDEDPKPGEVMVNATFFAELNHQLIVIFLA
jgi:hypothetical protein